MKKMGYFLRQGSGLYLVLCLGLLSQPLTPVQAQVQAQELGQEQEPGQKQGQADWQQAPLSQLRAAAEAGTATAQYALGLRLTRGRGILQDYAQAARWFRLAADQNHTQAQIRLGQAYFEGLGVIQDIDQAQRWLQRAASTGAAQPLFALASLLESQAAAAVDPQVNLSQAADLYRRAADLGHMDSAVSLGVLYQNGSGVAQDLDLARQLYEAPAAAGHARALNNLGLLYVRGDGVVQDYAHAAQLFQAAADQGLAVALNNLGTLYENGFGVAPDEAYAAQLYRAAADLKRSSSIADLRPGMLYDRRLQPPDSSAEALRQMQDAARAGDPLAQFQLAWMLLQPEATTGRGGLQQARRLMQSAAETGYPAAMGNMALFYVDGTVLPQDYVQAYMWLVLASTAGQPEAADLAADLARKMTAQQILEAQHLAKSR